MCDKRKRIIKVDDFEEICRLCLEKDPTIKPILIKTEEEAKSGIKENVVKRIFACTNIQIYPNDGLPRFLCSTCLLKLNSCFTFRQQCLESDRVLQLVRDEFDEELMKSMNIPVGVPVNNVFKESGEKQQTVVAPSVLTSSSCSNRLFREELKDNDEDYDDEDDYEDDEDYDNSQDYSDDSDNSDLDDKDYDIKSGKRKKTKCDTTADETTENDSTLKSNDRAERSKQLRRKRRSKEQIAREGKLPRKPKRKLSKEEKITKKKVCPVCGKLTFTLTQHMVRHGEKNIKCEICGRGFHMASTLKKHMEIHAKPRKHYKCELCNKDFDEYKLFASHETEHAKTKSYRCDICGNTYGYRNTLTAHRKVHFEEATYGCQQCDKKFLKQSGLIKHMRIHSTYRPFKCDMCDKTFYAVGNLNTHKRLHSLDKPYKCNKCPESFYYHKTFYKHLEKSHGLQRTRNRRDLSNLALKPQKPLTSGKRGRPRKSLQQNEDEHNNNNEIMCGSTSSSSQSSAIQLHQEYLPQVDYEQSLAIVHPNLF